MNATATTQFTHRATLNGETIEMNADTMYDAMEALMARHPGKGVPAVEAIVSPVERAFVATPEPARAPVAPAPAPARVATIERPVEPAPVVRGQTIDAEGAARSAADEFAARGSGFAPARPLYAQGTMILDVGVDTACAKRQEFDEMPVVRDYCVDFAKQIADEKRRDLRVVNGELRMRTNGRIVTGAGNDVVIDRDTFSKLMGRMMPGKEGPGGGEYLAKCPPKLRASNFNNWATMAAAADEEEREAAEERARRARKPSSWSPTTTVLRTRRSPSHDFPEVFGVVSESYATFDVDRVAEALRLAAPADARGSVRYDGTRATFEVLFHTSIEPERCVAGEFFRAGVRVTTGDVGGQGIRVSALVYRNLCLNFMIIDAAEQKVASLRHVGTTSKLAAMFSEKFKEALDKVAHFRRAWGYAMEEDVLVRAAAVTSDYVPMKVSEALPGLFNGILEHDLVPVRGNKKEAVKRLADLYFEDEGGVDRERVSRAAVVNAFTRYAHKVAQPDAFVADEIEGAAGALLFGRYDGKTSRYLQPSPLPYEPLT